MRGNEKARDRMGERWNDAGRKKGGSVGQRRRKHGDVWFTWLSEGLGWQFPAMRPIWWEQSNYYSTLSSGNNKLVREPDWETTKDGTNSHFTKRQRQRQQKRNIFEVMSGEIVKRGDLMACPGGAALSLWCPQGSLGSRTRPHGC